MLRLSPLPWRFSCYTDAILIAIAIPSTILVLIVIVVCRLSTVLCWQLLALPFWELGGWAGGILAAVFIIFWQHKNQACRIFHSGMIVMMNLDPNGLRLS
uniref:HDC10274 n=1 Tax=Drosophila melanogaster TaxID=7227 RepID=Q6IL62_DROME|nr:TPA_inf: HDC10274 [Drosophila melanogaster]